MASNDSNRIVAIVTGASSGIGAATARMFAGRQCAVSLAGRNVELERLDGVAQQCREAAGNDDSVLTTIGDLLDDEHLESLVQRTADKYGKIDVLVNNAGAWFESTEPTVRNDLELFDKTMDVNVKSVIKLTRLCEPHLIKSKGNVVNVGSIDAELAGANDGFHAMSKAALHIYTKAQSLRLAPYGVRANVVSPGAVDTQARWIDDEMKRLMGLMHPLGRMGRTDEIAELITFLADNGKAAFITGSVFNIDGGAMASNAIHAVMSMQQQ